MNVREQKITFMLAQSDPNMRRPLYFNLYVVVIKSSTPPKQSVTNGSFINNIMGGGKGFCDDSLSTEKRDNGGRRRPNLRDVIYGQPLSQNYFL